MRWRAWTLRAWRSCRRNRRRPGPETERAARAPGVGPPFAPWQSVSMTAPADDLPLAAEFPAATREAWRRLGEGVPKGATFDARLVANTYDGLAIAPLYG